ncbi:MAG: flagellin [Gammaproteobacteria bacterium]|nr:flagellin [Gammaproteobacteria bacterium]MBU1623778.1 flagellin [Gammaproteobacteria bacterium]MBU1981995.1 flagellin [Gammaproteobacteria bacterium]
MAQVINTNVAALFAGAALNKSAIALQTAQQRLSSGLRINSAKDDSTGLATATAYDTQIRAANVNVRLKNDAISAAQTSDGKLGIVTENLQRMSEILAGNGGVSNAEFAALDAVNTTLASAGGANTYATGIANVAANLTAVGARRETLGASMASNASEVAALQIDSVNLSAAYSRIMDTDYAAETTAMARNNILQQAGTAVLAQANQTPNTVLTLLR